MISNFDAGLLGSTLYKMANGIDLDVEAIAVFDPANNVISRMLATVVLLRKMTLKEYMIFPKFN